MKITFDTVAKQTICPPEFFDYIRNINDASELTGSTTTITPETYLDKIIKEGSKVIVNKNDIAKRKRTNRKPTTTVGKIILDKES